MIRTYCIAILFILSYSPGFAADTNSAEIPSCMNNPNLQLLRSQELNELAAADQDDRKDWQNQTIEQLYQLTQRDLIRLKRVGEIFGEGCFKDPSDYMNAALIYQHGDTPDHYYQAFIFSSKAAKMGDPNGQAFSALAMDRYLVSIDQKQLFGSQFYKLRDESCFCIQPVEHSFPDERRKQYAGRSLEDNYQLLASLNPSGCPNIECNQSLKPTPEGSIIGFW